MLETILKGVDMYLNIVGNVMTILASSIAIYIFFKNKSKIVSAINFILNFSYQITLNDLKMKIERLNDYKVKDESQKEKLIDLLHDIQGQIFGNKILNDRLQNQLQKMAKFINSPKMQTEPNKRSLVSELRESLRHLDISNFEQLIKNLNSK